MSLAEDAGLETLFCFDFEIAAGRIVERPPAFGGRATRLARLNASVHLFCSLEGDVGSSDVEQRLRESRVAGMVSFIFNGAVAVCA